MSKLKISLSAVLMLIFLSMFGAAAFAARTDLAPVTTPDQFTPTADHPAQSGITNSDGNSVGVYVGTINNSGQKSTHRTHGNFQNNTASCANCHSTHNGENAQLLMKSGEYELCMSCHDGTMGFYNVSTASEAGLFNDSANAHEMSASMHNVEDVALSAAPGAIATDATSDTATFECSSCHNPHGSVNDRLLNETVAGKTYANTFNVTIVGYSETITKTPLAKGNTAIKLDLYDDPEYADFNNQFGDSGLKIKKSRGIYTAEVKDPDTGAVIIPKADVYNYRLNLAGFCSACHDDYLKNRETEVRADGHYTHTTTSTKAGRTCVSCHYAHGTDETILKDTAGKTIADLTKPVVDGGKGWEPSVAHEYMKDVTVKGSSLKRFTNMAVCWSCHSSTHAIDTNKPADADFTGKSSIK